MARFILKHRGGAPQQEDIALIEGTEGVTIHDRTAGALLVDASEDVARGLHERLPDWVLAPETTFPPPEPVRRRAPDEDSGPL